MRSKEEIATILQKRVEFMILQLYPKPTCNSKKKQWAADVQEIKKILANHLSPQGLGIKIEI